jgi:hypothetical protein
MNKPIPPPPGYGEGEKPPRPVYNPTDPIPEVVRTRTAYTVKRTGAPGLVKPRTERVRVKDLMRHGYGH